MENKTTIINKNITTNPKKVLFPETGDTLSFCKDEESAFKAYSSRIREHEAEHGSTRREYLTDMFKLKQVKGTLCEPIYINGKRYGFVGGRFGSGKKHVFGVFFLFEMV